MMLCRLLGKKAHRWLILFYVCISNSREQVRLEALGEEADRQY
jgi:hypothetical protein